MSNERIDKKNVKSFKAFREAKGREWNKRVSKGSKKEDEEVVLNIGLMEWSEKDDCLRPKRGKKIAVRVASTISYHPLLKLAEEKWRNFHSNLYDANQVYYLAYEDGRKAFFIPGSTEEEFTLKRYREEIGKDYKRITLFLCAESDFDKLDKDWTTSTSSEIQVVSPLSDTVNLPLREEDNPAAKHAKLESDHDTFYDYTDLSLDSSLEDVTRMDEQLAFELQKEYDENQNEDSRSKE